MGAERFLQLFDWNSKSKKKLFPNKSEFSEESKQGKRSNRRKPDTRYDQVDEVESRAGSSIKGSTDHSCASSVVDDDGYIGEQAPSVVARLMGLNSMPTHNCSEPSSTPFFDSQSLRSSHYEREHIEFEQENQMYYSKPRKVPSRPLEKFQSEVLPPRSAKSIPITQHKLLSPIKSSGMFFTGDAAHIMEAAAKIIESGSQAIGKNKMPMIGSSSLPIKVKDLKEKVKATQERPEMGFSFASFRVSENDRVHAARDKISSAQSQASFSMRDREKIDVLQEKTSIGYSSVSLRTKDKERPDAIQEKISASATYVSTSFRLREKDRVDAAGERIEPGCRSGSFRAKDKERPEDPLKLSRPASVSEKPFESSAAKSLKEQSINKSWNGSRETLPFSAPSDAKINSSSNKGKSVSLAIQAKVNVQKREGMRLNSSRQKEQQHLEVKSQPSHTVKNIHKRSSTQNGSNILRQNNQRQNNATDKGMFSKSSSSNSASKKTSTGGSSSTRHKSSSNSKESSRTRKLSIDATNIENDQANSIKNVPRKKRNIDGGIMFEGSKTADNVLKKSLKSEANVDRYAWIEDSRKKGMDVVSFTFTSPMSRPTSGFNSSSQMAQITDDKDSGKKLNVIGSDALSLLLEHKLRELTTSIDMKTGALPKFASNIMCEDTGSTASKLNEHLDGHHKKRLCSRFDSGFQIQPLKEEDEMDAFSSNHAEAKNLNYCHLPSPASILESSFTTESCNSSRSTDSVHEDSMLCSSVQACEVIGLDPSKKFYHIESDLFDSASSISPETSTRNDASRLIVTNIPQSATKWELNYVKDILSNLDIMFENFSAGITPGIIYPQLFEELESFKGWSSSIPSMLERKLFFDCVSDSLDLRCKRYIGGGCEAWCTGMMTVVKRKEKLAEELCKEILGLASLSDCMVDELVDKDMSSQHGKWLNFETEEFSLGVEMEVQILNSLVDEMVADFLQY